MLMNEYEINDAVERFDDDETPNLHAGALVLQRLCRWTNRNSDGWAYWQVPGKAARRLEELLSEVDRLDPQDCSDADLKKACTPIKAFLTKQGVDHKEVFPPPPSPRAKQFREFFGDEYDDHLLDPEEFDINKLGRFVMIEVSRFDSTVCITSFDDVQDAADYRDVQEYPEDWNVEHVVDLETGDEYDLHVRTTAVLRQPATAGTD